MDPSGPTYGRRQANFGPLRITVMHHDLWRMLISSVMPITFHVDEFFAKGKSDYRSCDVVLFKNLEKDTVVLVVVRV